MVGTPKNMLHAGAEARTADSSKWSNTAADAPAVNAPNSPAHSPCTWNSGRQRSRRSAGSHSQAPTREVTPASSEAWVWTAPLGAPVVPDV